MGYRGFRRILLIDSAVEQVLAGIHEEAWLVIVVQRAQPHPSAAAESPNRSPMVCFQIVQQGNLLLEFIDGLSIHGLLTSDGRIQRIAVQSQARMVGGMDALQPVACQSFAQAPAEFPNTANDQPT